MSAAGSRRNPGHRDRGDHRDGSPTATAPGSPSGSPRSGSRSPTSSSSATAPRTSRRGCGSWPREGCDLIVTSGGLGSDRRRPDRRGRRALRRAWSWCSTSEMEAKIAAIIAGFARRMRFDPEAPAGGQPQAGDGPARRRSARPGRDRAGPRGPGRGRPGRRRAARSAARAARDVGRRARRPRRSARCSRGPSPTPSRRCGCSACPSRRSRSPCARSSADDGPLAARDHHLPASRRARDRRAPPSGRRGSAATRSSPGSSSATSGSSSASTAPRSTSRSPTLLREGRTDRARRVVHGRAARGAARRIRPAPRPTCAGGVVAYSNQAKVDLLGRRPPS